MLRGGSCGALEARARSRQLPGLPTEGDDTFPRGRGERWLPLLRELHSSSAASSAVHSMAARQAARPRGHPDPLLSARLRVAGRPTCVTHLHSYRKLPQRVPEKPRGRTAGGLGRAAPDYSGRLYSHGHWAVLMGVVNPFAFTGVYCTLPSSPDSVSVSVNKPITFTGESRHGGPRQPAREFQ